MHSVIHRPMFLQALLAAILLGLAAGSASARSYLVDFGGEVVIERGGTPLQLGAGMTLQAGDRLLALEEGWLLVGFTERAAFHLAGHGRALLLPREGETGVLRVQLDGGVVRLATETPFEVLTPEGILHADWANVVLKSGSPDAGIAAIEGEVTVTHPDNAIQGSWSVETGGFRALSPHQMPGAVAEIPNAWLAGIGPELTPCGCGDVLSHLLPDASHPEETQESKRRDKAIAPPALCNLPLDPMMQRDRPLSRPMVVPR